MVRPRLQSWSPRRRSRARPRASGRHQAALNPPRTKRRYPGVTYKSVLPRERGSRHLRSGAGPFLVLTRNDQEMVALDRSGRGPETASGHRRPPGHRQASGVFPTAVAAADRAWRHPVRPMVIRTRAPRPRCRSTGRCAMMRSPWTTPIPPRRRSTAAGCAGVWSIPGTTRPLPRGAGDAAAS